MPKASHSITLRYTPKPNLIPVYAITLLLIFHTFVVAYMNSSFLEQFISATAVGSTYIIGSAISILIFLFISRVLRRLGSFKLTMFLLIANMAAVVGMAYADSLRVAIPLFLVHITAIPLIVFNIDVFMEHKIGENEGSTGGSRGLLLTLSSLIGALSPLVSSLLVDETTASFTNAYLLSAGTLLPVIAILILFFSDFPDPKYKEVDIFSALRTFWRNLDVRNVFLTHFILQMFFMCMVVYAPIYLTDNIGLTWRDFGIIMFFGQMAYVLLEYPIGVIADKYIGEKEMMAFGCFIIAISTSWIAFTTEPSILVWSIIMFMTRVGASFVEVTTEAYFFKQTKGGDAQIISFFRITRPLSYVTGALLASFTLLFLPFNLLFVVFAALMVPALFFTLGIKDTK